MPPRPQLVPPRPRRSSRKLAPERPASPIHPFDLRYGTETGGLIPAAELRTGAPADRFVTAYYAVAPSILRALLELWQHYARPPFPLNRYSFLDIGCGKGRAMLVAAENPFLEVIGIELNPTLAAVARANLLAAEGSVDPLTAVRLVEGDALLLPLPATPTVAFLFHPFAAPALRQLLRAVEAAFVTRAGQLDLLYVNAEHASVLDRSPAFTRLWQGRVPMSTEDHLADLKEIENQVEYGSTGDELCSIYRFVGRQSAPAKRLKTPPVERLPRP